MNLKVAGGIIALGLLAIVLNHYVLDWGAITSRKIEDRFAQLISAQRTDLNSWQSFEIGDPRFQKRRICGEQVINWSDNKPWVDEPALRDIQILEAMEGIFLIQTIIYSENCRKTSIYPLRKNYQIANKFLKSRMDVSLPRNLTNISEKEGDFRYENLFYYDLKETPSKSIDAIAGIVIVIVLLWLAWKGWSGFFYQTLLVVLLVRALTLYFNILEQLFNYPLFDPLIYKSSNWNPTLGDLFVNCLLLFLMTISWSRKFRKDGFSTRKYQLYIFFITGILFSISIYTTSWSVLDNSQLSLDLGKSIQFDFRRIMALLTILFVVGSQFLVTFRCVGLLNAQKNKSLYYLFLVLVSGIAFLVSEAAGGIALLFLVIIFISSQLNWTYKLKQFRYQNLQFVLLVSVSVALVLSVSVYAFHEKSELDTKRKFANYLLIKRDVLSEYYLNQLLKEIRDREFRNISVEEAKKKVETKFLNPYLDKYKVRLIDPLEDSLSYYQILPSLAGNALSDYENIYFLDNESSFHYYCFIDRFLIHLDLKKRVPSSVFPALLTDNKYFAPSDNFDYAVFKGGHILFQRSKFGQGEWPTSKDFENVALYKEGIEKNKRHYYGVKTVDGRIILIISKKYSRHTQLTNFSFYFLLTFFFIASIVLLSSISMKQIRLNFTSKIQLYLGLAFVIPLFSAGFALLSSLNSSYREEINRNYLKRSLYLSELLSGEESATASSIGSARLADIRDIIQADISLYDSVGTLLATSQREIFDLKLQGELINPIVYDELIKKENQSVITDESIGTLDYKVSYTVLNDYNDHVKGFIATPFFDSKNHLSRQQQEVFGSLISIFGFIFILAILFGNLILNNLMQPLRLVAEKISKVNLQEENKPILYQSTDEIGSLVTDYNAMLVKLEESKAALARSQKETAWKEIARQVAHEIKNPLTPMQLKIQQLLRKQEEGSKDHETLRALLTQVGNLSQIASSFSAFAEMPAPNNSTFDLSNVMQQVVSLYRTEGVTIETEVAEVSLVHADKDIFQRILNNIVLNAIQSVEGKQAHIRVALQKKSGKCEVSITDNGKGVPDDLKDKIFLNYFSTKSKGSGIGLALAKKGIENAGGNIWFESKEGEGTTFFISMPLATSLSGAHPYTR